jgi:hypothetical protein
LFIVDGQPGGLRKPLQLASFQRKTSLKRNFRTLGKSLYYTDKNALYRIDMQ